MRLRSAATAGALAVALAPVPHAGAAAFVPRCHRIAVSPAFAKDGTAYCVTWVRDPAFEPTPVPNVGRAAPHTTDVGLYRTTDRARSWRRVETDLPWDADSMPGGLALSPRYATDGLLAIHVSNYGVLASTDRGETFLPIDPSAISAFGNPPHPGLLTSFATTAGPATTAAFAFFDGSVALTEADPNDAEPVRKGWNGNSALIPAAGGHVPAAGAPGLGSDGFQLSNTFGSGGRGYLLTQHVETHQGLLPPTGRYAVWACSTTLDCDQPVTVFPDNWGASDLVLLDPAGMRLGILLYEPRRTGDDDYRPPLLRARESRDGGVTWRPWTAVERALAPFNGAVAKSDWAAGSPALDLAVEPTKHRRVVLRVTSGSLDDDGRPLPPGRLAAPGEQIWVSDDTGATFRRTAYGPAYGQRGRGTLPWRGADVFGRVGLAVAPDGRILTSGFATRGPKVTYAGLYCSTDGRRWDRTC